MIQKIRKFQRKWGVFFLLVILTGSLAAGCASESSSHESSTTQSVNGQTVTSEHAESKTTTHESHTGLFGGVFHIVGEILAFPFEVIAGVFRFIF